MHFYITVWEYSYSHLSQFNKSYWFEPTKHEWFIWLRKIHGHFLSNVDCTCGVDNHFLKKFVIGFIYISFW